MFYDMTGICLFYENLRLSLFGFKKINFLTRNLCRLWLVDRSYEPVTFIGYMWPIKVTMLIFISPLAGEN
jgi:hypothetical protein